jgi:hypothetical protein
VSALPPRLVVVSVLAVGLSIACAARRFDRLMQNWEGRPLSQLLTTWGPPRSVYSDGNGGHVIVYVPASDAAPAAQRHASTTAPPQASASWQVYRLFFVDLEGRISGVRWKGEWVCCGM